MLSFKKYIHCRGNFYLRKSLMKFFDLHEYQSKEIFRKNGLNVQGGALATSPEEAFKIAKNLTGDLIIKAQVHAGGRGKGRLTSGLQGGVKFCNNAEEVKNYADQMINYNLITHQTPKEGLLVKSVLVLESVDIKKQIYLAFFNTNRVYFNRGRIFSRDRKSVV